MNLIEFLSGAHSDVYISDGSYGITQKEFESLVYSVAEDVSALPKEIIRDYVVLLEDDPINYFVLLFAFWLSGRKVVMPNSDLIENRGYGKHFAGTASLNNGKLEFNANDGYISIKLPECCDVICFSSGSTGAPKGILHAHADFLGNAEALCGQIELEGFKSITPLGPNLVSAVSHFMLNWLKGADITFISYAEAEHVLPALYAKDSHQAFVGSPMHIINCLQFIPAVAKPDFFFSSGDFIYPNNITKVIEKFPTTKFYHVYGLAELAGRFFINAIDQGTNEINYLDFESHLRGIEFKVIEDELYVSSRYLFSGYLIEDSFVPSDTWHKTGDLVELTGAVVRLVGRSNDEVKIGGNKVSLKRIESIVSMLLPNDFSIVVDVKHERFGRILVHAIKSDVQHSRIDLISMLRESLKSFEIPQVFCYLDKVPYKKSMKINRDWVRDNYNTLKKIN